MIKKLSSIFRYGCGIKTPIKVAHYVTYRCNLSCEMCGRRLIDSNPKDELKTSEAIEIQKDFRRHGTLVWSFSGGECLLRDDIITQAKSVKDLGMDLIVVTNGILLPEKKEILEYADVVNVSVDGNEKTHDRIRGDGNYGQVLKGLNVLEKNERDDVKRTIQVILNNETIESDILNHSLELAVKYNCEIGFNPAIVHRSDIRDINAKSYFPTNEQFKNFKKWFNEKSNSKYNKYLLDPPGFFECIGNYPNSPKKLKCYAGLFQCSIDPFGRILPCSDFCDFDRKYLEDNMKFGYGYSGFENLKKPACPYEFCCTAKKNYFFDNPIEILKKYAHKKKIK